MSVTPPTEQEMKDFVVASVGDYNGIIAANIDLIWTMTSVYAPYPPLQTLWAMRIATQMLAGQVWQAVTAAVDDTRQSLSDMHDHLMDQLKDLDGQIAIQTPLALAGQGALAVSGLMTAITPTTPPPGAPDANDPRYIGNPYLPLGVVP